MTRPTLSKCIECGGLVSSQASQCPRCSSRYPLGVKCIVCCQTLKRSEALKLTKEYGGAENRVSVKFFHYSCHEQISQIRIGRARTSCPTCHAPIEFDTASSVNCHNCGQIIPTNLANPSVAHCCYCGFLLNKSLEVAIKEVSRPFLSGIITETLYAHRICYTSERQEQEEQLKKRQKLDQSRITRKKAEIRRSKQVSKNKETLAFSIFLGLAAGIIIGGVGGGISHFVFSFSSSWQSAALIGFGGVSILTVVAVWIFSLFE